MHKFIIFENYTDKGIKNITNSPSRLASAKELAKEFNGKISSFYLTLGQYDFFLICFAAAVDKSEWSATKPNLLKFNALSSKTDLV